MKRTPKTGKEPIKADDRLSERLEKEMLASYIQLRESYDRYDQTKENLHKIVSRSVQRLVETKSAHLMTFAKKNDVIAMNFLRDKNSILVVRSTGSEVHSTLALLSYLQLCIRPTYNIYAMPQVEAKLQSKLLKFVSSKNTELCVVFDQATPHLDGFYLMIPQTARIDRSKDVLDFVTSKGHEVGIYSLEEDRPTFQLTHSNDGLLNALASVVPEVYGFGVSDDIWAGVNAVAFVLGDFDFGILPGNKGSRKD